MKNLTIITAIILMSFGLNAQTITTVAGSIELFGPAAGTNKNTAHCWKLYSADRSTWQWLMATGDAHTILTGFAAGSNQNLSHTEVIGEEAQEESQIIVVRAKG